MLEAYIGHELVILLVAVPTKTGYADSIGTMSANSRNIPKIENERRVSNISTTTTDREKEWEIYNSSYISEIRIFDR